IGFENGSDRNKRSWVQRKIKVVDVFEETFDVKSETGKNKSDTNILRGESKKSIDHRSVKAGLLHKAHVEYDMAVKEVVNPDDKPSVAVYGAAGMDVSNFLLSTNVTESYFISKYYRIDEEELKICFEGGRAEKYCDWYLEKEDYSEKQRRGYAYVRTLWDRQTIVAALVFELKAMGVDINKVQVDSNEGKPRIKFKWNYSGCNEREYSITFVDADITKPETYIEALKNKKIGIYYQRASMEVAGTYEEEDCFLYFINSIMRKNGFYVTDDYLVSPNGEKIFDMSDKFPIVSKKKTIKEQERLTLNIVTLRKGKEEEDAGDLYAEGRVRYGWYMCIRQKTEAKEHFRHINQRSSEGGTPRVAHVGGDKDIETVVEGEVVGRVKIVENVDKEKQYKDLWGTEEHDIVAVRGYPMDDPTMATPAGIITCDEQSSLSHSEVRARAWGVPHLVVGDLKEVETYNGKWIYINARKGKTVFRLATQDEIANYKKYLPEKPRVELAEADLSTERTVLEWGETTNPSEVSYKFSGLHAVSDEQFNRKWHDNFSISTGSVIPYATYKKVLAVNPVVQKLIEETVKSIDNKDINDIRMKLEKARNLIMEMEIPQEIWANKKEKWNIKKHIDTMTDGDRGIFVRAGTTAEDLPKHPGFGAGMYGTIPNVKRAEAKDAIKQAWASIWNIGAYIERQKLGLDHFAVYPAVQLTEAISAEYSFVIHTADPNTGNDDFVVIEFAQGFGESIVSDKYPGRAHRYVYSKKQDKIIEFTAATKKEKAVLNTGSGVKREPANYDSDMFAREQENSKYALYLARSAQEIEMACNGPQDIEGVLEYDKDTKRHKMVITQLRSQVEFNDAVTGEEERMLEVEIKVKELMEKHKNSLNLLFPYSSLSLDITKRIREGGAKGQEIYWIMKCLLNMGDNGTKLAGKILFCGSGIHKMFQEGIEKFDAEDQAKLVEAGIVDLAMLDREQMKVFEWENAFNIAKIITRKDCTNIFPFISPRKLAILLEEINIFCNMPKEDYEVEKIKISEAEILEAVGKVYSGYSEPEKEEFKSYWAKSINHRINIEKKQEREQTAEEFAEIKNIELNSERHRVIILTASIIDGCSGMKDFFDEIYSGEENRVKDIPCTFFLLMDIKDERIGSFLRRNHLLGRYFGKIISTENIAEENLKRTVLEWIDEENWEPDCDFYSEMMDIGNEDMIIVGSEKFLDEQKGYIDEFKHLEVLKPAKKAYVLMLSIFEKLNRKKEESDISKQQIQDFIDEIIIALETDKIGENIIIGIDTGWISRLDLGLLQKFLNQLQRKSRRGEDGWDRVKIVIEKGGKLAECLMKLHASDAVKNKLGNMIILGKKGIRKTAAFKKLSGEDKNGAFFAEIEIMGIQSRGMYLDIDIPGILRQAIKLSSTSNIRNMIFEVKLEPIETGIITKLKDRYDAYYNSIEKAV
ncbi:MAG: hypothetical protein KAI70_02005, partial [Candidatus Omnitrophica bacterium]|nr:hypothetical protein [Candidatus Omnitrophota bacterium]